MHHDNLQAFLAVAEELKVKGLTQGKNFVGESSSTIQHRHTSPSPISAPPTIPHPIAPALPKYSAQMHGNPQAGPLARINSTGVGMPVQNNNVDSEVSDVKIEPESVQLEDSMSAEGQGGEHHGPEDYDQEQCSQICFFEERGGEGIKGR